MISLDFLATSAHPTLHSHQLHSVLASVAVGNALHWLLGVPYFVETRQMIVQGLNLTLVVTEMASHALGTLTRSSFFVNTLGRMCMRMRTITTSYNLCYLGHELNTDRRTTINGNIIDMVPMYLTANSARMLRSWIQVKRWTRLIFTTLSQE